MVLEIILQYLLQMGLSIGTIIVFGLLIFLCNKTFYKNFGNKAQIVCYITGFIGTPIHELSHALFCLIFAHKITEIKLFQINSEDGTLGYVKHSYNKRNLYQRAGNFFIGVAPIVVISVLLYGISCLLVPNMISLLSNAVRQGTMGANIGKVLTSAFKILEAYMQSPLFWVFILIGCFFALHMTLSTADIKGASSGIVIVLVSFLIVDIILGIVNTNMLADFTNVILLIATAFNTCLILSLVISAMALLLSFILKITIGKKLFNKIK